MCIRDRFNPALKAEGKNPFTLTSKAGDGSYQEFLNNEARYTRLIKPFQMCIRDSVYFVHSYYLKATDEAIVTATTEYSTHIHASVEKNNAVSYTHLDVYKRQNWYNVLLGDESVLRGLDINE